MDTKYALIGFARGIGFVVLASVLTYVGNAEHLAFLDPKVSTLIAALALGIEHAIEASTGRALMGAVRA